MEPLPCGQVRSIGDLNQLSQVGRGRKDFVGELGVTGASARTQNSPSCSKFISSKIPELILFCSVLSFSPSARVSGARRSALLGQVLACEFRQETKIAEIVAKVWGRSETRWQVVTLCIP